MIAITDKHQCCGCSSCAQRCPVHCITMHQDAEGFFYPEVDAAICMDCGLCEDACPIINQKHGLESLRAFAAKNSDVTVRRESSSGGIFTMLAKSIIRGGGVVFGASWNKDWNVEHTCVETLDGLKAFRSSKYVQSNIGNCYSQAEAFLKEGRIVLFSGTPCQVAGLKTYLCNEYNNLFTVECVCHGVPSPSLWQMYLNEVAQWKSVTYINHRDKCTGWRNYSVVIKLADGSEIAQNHDDNPWTRAFIRNLTLRPSCYSCVFKCADSMADITLGDLWGDCQLLSEHNEDEGISLVIVHTSRANAILKDVQSLIDLSIHDVSHYNCALSTSPHEVIQRSSLFTMVSNGNSFEKAVKLLTKDSLILRIKLFLSKWI